MLLLFDITDGNPNGDPDADNQPRQDLETNQGLATDGSVKRKIRDTIALAAQAAGLDLSRYRIFIEAGESLNPRLEESYTANGFDLETAEDAEDSDTAAAKSKSRKGARKVLPAGDAETALAWLHNRYFDLRMFGGVLGTGNTPSLGKTRGPLQVGFARSISPITPEQHTITRVAKARQTEARHGEIGNKWTIPYGLYAVRLHYSASRGEKTGVSSDDLRLLYDTLIMMWDHTSSAARADMATQGLFVFTHPNAFGAAPADALLRLVTITPRDEQRPPRSFTDYEVVVDHAKVPEAVTLTRLV
ncbi:type I-C CRISPR-associated protein Cas7/Csd2 [Solihabitans fulvus]|uniref:Type I-C CRISPR-associated protein Cas7/Csd2 n=2 Tax=Solihabitans fulvus TaxID=1892852 RepID=A0A5B2WLS3_9PSEU|nr:type I-C CRISPR-associated protein Cas7/Csd2 [Solihabitans fulvus]